MREKRLSAKPCLGPKKSAWTPCRRLAAVERRKLRRSRALGLHDIGGIETFQ